jgi:hypothetical protein
MFSFLLMLFSICSCLNNSVLVERQKHKIELNGIYRSKEVYLFSGGENICFDGKNGTFCLKRFPSGGEDVHLPICYDTVAKGKYRFLSSEVAQLSNDIEFLRPKVYVRKDAGFSKDTVYIHIELPKDVNFDSHRFRYHLRWLTMWWSSTMIDTPLFKIPKSQILKYSNSAFCISMQDLSTSSFFGPGICYQRSLFDILDDYPVDSNKNLYVVSMPEFTNCFIQRMHVENELIYVEGSDKIIWRGREYIKQQ